MRSLILLLISLISLTLLCPPLHAQTIPEAVQTGLSPGFCLLKETKATTTSDWRDDLPPAPTNSTDSVPVGSFGTFLSGINTFQFSDQIPKSPYKQYENVPTTILVNNGTQTSKTLFFASMDVLSMLHVVNSSHTAFLDGGSYGRVRIEQPTAFSASRRRMSDDCRVVVPFYTVIARVDNGVVTSYEFDDDCSTCPSENCVHDNAKEDHTTKNGNCGVPVSECTYNGGPTDCDLKIYLCWTGTDREGNRLTSAGRRLSQFRRWSLNAAWDAASQFASQNLPAPPDAIPEWNGLPGPQP